MRDGLCCGPGACTRSFLPALAGHGRDCGEEFLPSRVEVFQDGSDVTHGMGRELDREAAGSFERVGNLEHSAFAEMRPDDLHADREFLGSFAARNTDRGEAGQ